MKWQPIECAPEPADESDGGAVCYLVFYPKGREPECGSQFQVANGYWLKARGAEWGVSHWMPLPDEPQEAI